MLATALFASLIMVALQQQAPVANQDPPVDPVALEDVVVEGRSLESLTRDFVDEVGAPPPRRGLARWRGGVCVGVANVEASFAQHLADHVSRVAMEQGIRPADPGCRPNILIMFTSDGAQFAREAVAANRLAFRLGVGGLDRGNPALRAFQEDDAPVRWWHVSVPTNAIGGGPGIRLPGGDAPYVLGEGIVNKGRWIRDDLSRVFIIVDMDQVAGLTLPQLGDYLGLVAMAQIDPDADTRAYATILNLFDDPADHPGLTGWDRAYLRALYTGPSQRIRDSEQTYQLLRNLRRDQVSADARN